MAYLELQNLSKTFGGKVQAVKDFNLEINRGEFVAFLGPSGCGKSTTLRMIAGLERATRGEIILDGEKITHKQPRFRDISMIFQSYAIWPHMTVRGNIAYVLKLQKKTKEEIEETVNYVSKVSDISELLDRYPSQLSGGQRQRVAVARAIAVKPKVFLMDEPLSNLDAKLRVAMRTDLKRIHKELKATTIFVTHDQAEAMSLADRIVVMNKGIIQQIGTPHQVYHDPETMFIAQFMGSPPSNFFEVTVNEQSDGVLLKHSEFEVKVDGAMADVLKKDYLDKTVVYSVRPENIVVNKKSPIEVETSIVEPQGSHVIINSTLGNES
ncbi:MAG: ABC transporter ATP-binding protein, partial [Bacillota bacterium]